MKAIVCALLAALLALLGAGCSSQKEKPWVDEEVTFVADGLTLHGTYRHRPDSPSRPAALLISESGPTDRNGDNVVAGAVGNMRQLAEYLSQHEVASLRYDKVGTGQTGLGPYVNRRPEIGPAVFTAGAKAAVRFLAAAPGTDKDRISVYALGEGNTHAMALATDSAPDAPRIHSLGLLQPLQGRYLTLLTTRVRDITESAVKAGTATRQHADSVIAAWNAAVAQARADGTLPGKPLPDGLSVFLNPGNVKAVMQTDAIDPLAVAAKIPAGTPVLLTCSDVDAQSGCAGIKPLADALARTQLTVVRLKGVNHVLRDDPSDSVANYAKPGPLSPQLISALDQFVGE